MYILKRIHFFLAENCHARPFPKLPDVEGVKNHAFNKKMGD